jgi:hypothetical protein
MILQDIVATIYILVVCSVTHVLRLTHVTLVHTNLSFWVVIHMCMEAMLGISLYSYLYLKLAKMICLSYYLLCFLFNKIGEQEDSARKGGGGPNNIYTCE